MEQAQNGNQWNCKPEIQIFMKNSNCCMNWIQLRVDILGKLFSCVALDFEKAEIAELIVRSWI